MIFIKLVLTFPIPFKTAHTLLESHHMAKPGGVIFLLNPNFKKEWLNRAENSYSVVCS